MTRTIIRFRFFFFSSSFHEFNNMKRSKEAKNLEPSNRGRVDSRQDVLILAIDCQHGKLTQPTKLSSMTWKGAVTKDGSVFILQKTEDQISWRDDRKWHCILNKEDDHLRGKSGCYDGRNRTEGTKECGARPHEPIATYLQRRPLQSLGPSVPRYRGLQK